MLKAYVAKFKHLSHSTSSVSIYLLIDCFSNACEFSNLEFPLENIRW